MIRLAEVVRTERTSLTATGLSGASYVSVSEWFLGKAESILTSLNDLTNKHLAETGNNLRHRRANLLSKTLLHDLYHTNRRNEHAYLRHQRKYK